MSLDTVVDDIREEGQTRAEDIRAEAEERAEEILDEGERDAEEILKNAEQEVERQIEQEREQKLSSTKLEAKQERLAARREILQSVREDVAERIAQLEGDRRESLTRTLIEAAAGEFTEADVVTVQGREADQALLETVVEDYDGYEVGEPIDCLGGVVVDSDESRLRVDNTFDSILEDVWEDRIREISERLFEER